MSVEGVRWLATAVLRYALRTEARYEDSDGFEFWCGVLGISPTNCTTRLNRALGKLEEALHCKSNVTALS